SHEVNSLQPLVERDMAFLEDRAHADGELTTAVRALVEAVPLDAVRVLLRRLGADALQCVVLFHRTAVMADRTGRPKDFLDMLKRCGFVMEVGAGQDGHGWFSERASNVPQPYLCVMGLSNI